MIICSVIESVGAVLTVLLIIIGIVGVLVCIHCGSEYLRRDNELDSRQDAARLRHETNLTGGITEHSLFYRFFFRND